MNQNFRMIDEKLTSLGARGMNEEHPERDVREIEAAYGFVLPEEYGLFLRKYGGIEFEKGFGYQPVEKYPWTSEGDLEEIVIFYCLKKGNFSLVRAIDCYLKRMPESLIPIAECPGGNQLCIGIEGDVYGKVFLWDHDKEYMEYTSEEHLWWNIYETAESFTHFIMSLQVIEEKPVDTSGIVKVEFSDELRALAEKFKKKKNL